MKKIILFVVFFLIVLISYSASRPSKTEIAMELVTKNRIKAISEYLIEYQKLRGYFPKENYWFNTLNETIEVSEYFLQNVSQGGAPIDSWGNSLNYKYPGQINKDSFDLWSYGADGEVGGTSKNMDIGNW
ncbi:MAG: general secretion pathway protein G [Arenicella sp.]|jgi:general secretion pathway protein G